MKQDISWFEENNPQGLTTKINKEASAIAAATGEKAANIIMATTMSISGIVIAMIVGWKFCLVCLGVFPFIMLAIMFLVWVQTKGYKKGEAAFHNSSIVADQALASIKIVAAY